MKKDNILNLIATFFGIFGFSLLFAIYFSESERGQIVNLISGLIFIIASLGSFIMSKNTSKEID